MLGFFLMLGITVEGSAQQVSSSFEQLQVLVKPGDKIYVTDFAGKTTKGRISDLSKASLSLIVEGERQDWLQTDVREIKQWRGDSLANGAVIGALAGAGTTAVILGIYCGGSCENDGVAAGAILAYGGIGAAVGIGIDALIPSKRPIFLNRNRSAAGKFEIQPILSRSNQGVKVAFSF